jgi:hypothetical protein
MFIAVITVLYDSLSEQSNIFQMLETLKIRPQTEADKEYSALISIPAPFNVFHVFFAPFLLTSKRPQCLNQFLLSNAYLSIMGSACFTFIIYNFLLLPVCYIKLLWHKLIMIYVYSKGYRVSRADKFFVFVFFLFVGPFILFLNC